MNIFISGIGGSGAYYLAKYYSLSGNKVSGSDLEKNKRIEDLITYGIDIYIGKPNDNFINNKENNEGIDLYLYSSALKDDHPERVFINKKNINQYEIGELTDLIIKDYLKNRLSENEKNALIESNLAPLLKIEWNNKKYIAITGTDGKTTTVNMIYHILKKLDKRVAVISTIGCLIDDKFIETGLHTTTPSSQDLYNLLSKEEMKDIEYIILEVTSHALAMGRVAGAKFDVAGITNITTEHLDYHKNVEAYFQAKTRIITEHLKDNGIVILNKEDKSFNKLKKIALDNNIKFETIDKNFAKKILLLKDIDTEYNRLNASIAYKIVSTLTKERIDFDILSDFKGISGRMEYIQKEPFTIIVDFAHTENALKVLLKNLKNRLKDNSKLRVVFGCAGMRDKTKREKMGNVAISFADSIYICPEDPRLESLHDINREILKGIGIEVTEEDIKKEYIEFINFKNKNIFLFQEFSPQARYNAIRKAISDANKGDIIVICGKGHEKSLCFGTKEFEWSDQNAVRDILKNSNISLL
ncbi:MAG TPA: Mur ligase family protein [Spirochaetota bacterium]|nr:Mur ligase family protein [Spirochaetota bacterium]HOL58066.1 Mur ligase family protein [Spirochaetota bacterium]HPP05519.1 Mur ligase family protein [Spirochaetota bacterium]